MKKLNYKDAKPEKTTVSGYVVNGHFFGNNEGYAKMQMCTHVDCESCGKEIKKGYRNCEDCQHSKKVEKWESSEKRVQSPSDYGYYSELLGKYYFDTDEMRDDCHFEGLQIKDLLLYHLDREPAPSVDIEDVYEGITPEDLTVDDMITKEISDACDKLNKLIAEHPVNCFMPTKIGVLFE
jgi:hypothetical protein